MLFNGVEYKIQFWQGEELGRTLAIDTETTIKPFTETPDLITFQVFDGENLYYVDRGSVRDFLAKHSTRTMVFANAPFDIDVIEKHTGLSLKEQLENDKCFDINILFRLWKLAIDGDVPRKYSLARISEDLLGIELDKNEEIRCNFADFMEVPTEEIPAEFLEYGAKDVIATFHCFTRLRMEITRLNSTNNLSHHIQILGGLALNRMYKNGIGFDEDRATELLRQLNATLEVQHVTMSAYGFVKGIKGNQQAYNNVINYLGLKLPTTSEGDYSMKESDLEKYNDNHFVKSFLDYKRTEKTTFFIRKLKGSRVHPRYDLLKNTGRTGCSSPNIQQLPRDGDIRSMFKADSGNTLLITDYSAIELATLAQHVYVTQGSSTMRNKINEGADLHKYYASVLFNVPEDKVEKWQRQAAKAANFGFPGGLGIETFVEFAKGYDIQLTPEEAQTMKDTWFAAFPEMKEYMQGEEGAVTTLTGRIRANTTYCAEKNTAFQGLAADGAKIALYNLMDAGFKLVGFVHDEIITEVPENTAEEMRGLQEKIMVESMSLVVPDVKISVESTISPRYCK
tara:strand:+ start:7121 stop:8818 length:1698 start_codon:yes stop_codon:yes gene_type:complete